MTSPTCILTTISFLKLSKSVKVKNKKKSYISRNRIFLHLDMNDGIVDSVPFKGWKVSIILDGTRGGPQL